MPARLKAARLNRGLSVRQAAQQIGISRETLARAERGEGIHPAKAFQIASFFGFQVTDIWPPTDPEYGDGPGRRRAA